LKSFRKGNARSVKGFASAWVRLLNKNRRLLDLLSIVDTVLEKNVSRQSLIDFKRAVMEEARVVAGLLCALFPRLSTETAMKFLNLQMAAAIGLYQMTNLTEMQREVLELPELKHMRVDFSSSLRESVEYLMRGVLG
jgi:hypothetical protein